MTATEELRRLLDERDEARKSRDHWRRVASKHGNKVKRLNAMLEAERKLARMWPRYEDGCPVRVGDEIGFEGGVREVRRIEFTSGCYTLRTEFESRVSPFGHTVDRPPLKASDGAEIREGQVLYGFRFCPYCGWDACRDRNDERGRM